MDVTEIATAVEAELARLRAENARLLRLLKLTPQQAAPPGPAQAAYFEAPPGLVYDGSPPEAKVAFYAALFAARTDVYVTRLDNPRTGKGGWVPAVRGGWHKGIWHQDRDYLPLTPAVLAAHLKGEVHIGLYPLLDGDRCWWLAADFDGPEAIFDASCTSLRRQGHRRGPRLPRRAHRRPSLLTGQARTRLHQPRLPRSPETPLHAKRRRSAHDPIYPLGSARRH